MDFLTTEVTTYKTGCLVNFLPCMAVYICSRPGTLWSDSLTILPCLWSILRDWMQNTLSVWQHIVLWQRGPLSQPACCQAKSYPHKTHPVIYWSVIFHIYQSAAFAWFDSLILVNPGKPELPHRSDCGNWHAAKWRLTFWFRFQQVIPNSLFWS